MKLEPIEDLFARLTTHELALEIVFANMLASMPPEAAEQFKADFVSTSTRTYGKITGDLNEARIMQEMTRRVGEVATRLMDKAGERAAELRS